MTNRSAVIHLSDLECGTNNRAENPSVVGGYRTIADALVDDLRGIVGNLLPTRIGLVVSGDVADRGTPEEYQKAGEVLSHIIDRLEIAAEHVAVMPGNHDVSWPDAEACFKRAFPDGPNDPAHRANIRGAPEKIEQFRRFVHELCGLDFPSPETVVPFPGFADLGIALVGFDTTYPCTFVRDDNFGLLRRDPVKAGGRALREILATDDRLVPVALLHHCPIPLADQSSGGPGYLHNATEALEMLRAEGFGVILCGHEHQARATDDLRAGIQIYATGSFGLDAVALRRRYGGRAVVETNRYQIFRVDPEGTTEVVFRRLRDPGAVVAPWVSDFTEPASVGVNLRRPQLENHDPNSIRSSARLCISHPFPLPDGKEWVVAVRLLVDESRAQSIRTVTYEVGGRSFHVRDRSDGFMRDMVLGEPAGTITATVECENRVQTLSAEIPDATGCTV